MGSLYRSGHIQSIFVKVSATPIEIDKIVKAAFVNLTAIQTCQVSMREWRLLSKVPRDKGVVPLLYPHKPAGDVTAKDLEWYWCHFILWTHFRS
jgi:hypothetical protein